MRDVTKVRLFLALAAIQGLGAASALAYYAYFTTIGTTAADAEKATILASAVLLFLAWLAWWRAETLREAAGLSLPSTLGFDRARPQVAVDPSSAAAVAGTPPASEGASPPSDTPR